MPVELDSAIATEAKDLLPETWEALRDAETFGEDALIRRATRVVKRIFGVELTTDEQELLDDLVIEYAGKKLALALLDPAIEYWSRQIISRTAGERESSAYKDRAEDLRKNKKEWVAELAAMWLDVEPLIPVRPSRNVDAPRVIQAGETVPHLTPQLDDMRPQYGLPEDVA